ncbi:alpha/beta fold hydrolase [Ruegeria sp. Ofav3-42]|uniref:alpha/beta fold hydrolase n=1 Tax=Ruegeria sp. Ofav3-42 TaxID=2917759 RepID=UPI001EF61B62|nr:alpha/beta fold hydrolase [Ruegeria sp. Ofav3-42]MCG7520373.1 alpha/beta fold hydrolase [Ruegeria sp. Ofav3-42]
MSLKNRTSQDTPGVSIKEAGSFFTGGRRVTLTGQPVQQIQVARNAPARTVDMNGDYITGQCYVQYLLQSEPEFDAPLMFWHGGGMTGATWETTPDGRPGWHNFFLNAGFDTYLCDAVERGRASWSPYPQIYKDNPVFRTQNDVWTMFRFGPAGAYKSEEAARHPFDGNRFPLNALDMLGAQLVPRWTAHAEMTLDAYYRVLARVGPVWMIAHSQGGNLALEAAATHPEFFKGVVVIEPASAPPATGKAAQVPHLFIWGDFIDEFAIWISYRKKADRYADQLRSNGGSVQLLDLPSEGITGNTHVMMMDDNSDQIAELVLDWIKKNELSV